MLSLYVLHSGISLPSSGFWQHGCPHRRFAIAPINLSFIEVAWLFESGEIFIKVIANINLQSCKGFGLSVTIGEVPHNR